MNRSEVEQLMEKVKHAQSAMNPRPEWVAETRSRVLRHIELTSAETPQRVMTLNHLWTALSFIMPQRTVYAVVRPAVIFLLCFGIGTGGWITTVSASLNSLPGDALYPVKLASEHTQVAVVDALQGRAASTELRLSLVRRRSEEVQKIVNTPTLDQGAKTARVQAAVDQLKTEVQSVHDNLVAIQQPGNSPQEVAAVAQVITDGTNEIKQNLSDTDMHASSADALVAIEQLQQDAGKAQEASSTVAKMDMVTSTARTQLPLALGEASSTTATSTEVNDHAASSTAAVTSTSTSVSSVRDLTANGTVITIINADNDPLKNFPERPAQLAPDVVDTATPIKIETWQ